MIGNARFHRRRNAQSLMHSCEIVVHEMNGNGINQVLNLLRKPISKARKSTHTHSHCQVLPFDVTRGDVLRIGVSDDIINDGSDALSRAIPRVIRRGAHRKP